MRLTYSEQYFTFDLECDYSQKEIPKNVGFKWNPNRRVWYTDNSDIASELLHYGDEKVFEKIDQLKQRTVSAIQESQAVKSNIIIPKPNGLDYLPFQKAGIEYALKRSDTLIADEMGLGKTIQAIGVINGNDLIRKVLIVCPATMKLIWKAELEKWLVNTNFKISVWTTKSQEDGDIIIINYEILVKFDILKHIPFSLLIGDEIHYCKSKPWKKTTKGKGSGSIRSREFYAIAKKAIKRLYLTGTPILNKPAELFYILKSLNFPMDWGDFMTRYANGHIDERGHWDTKGSSNLDELQEKLRGHLMVRRLKKDVLKELPDKVRQIIELEEDEFKTALSKEEKYLKDKQKSIRQLKANIKRAEDGEDKEIYNQAVKELKEFNLVAFGDLSRVRHLSALKKVPSAIKHITEVMESADKIVIFAHHTDVLDKIYRAFEDKAILFTGDTPSEERKELVDHFQNDPNCKLFIASIKAGGIGITLTASSTVIFVELDWTPAVMSQAEDRLHRIGQENAVLVQHLVINGSIDSKIAKMCVRKQEVITQALDKPITVSEMEEF